MSDNTPPKTPHGVWVDIIDNLYGHRRSRAAGEAVDAEGQPLPIFSYPAIEYLRQLDFSRCRLFEYGSGGSTAFWSRRFQHVWSVEHNPDWFARLQARALPNVTAILEPGHAYPDRIYEVAEPLDVIIIDGIARFDCAFRAIDRIRPGGLIILDNSDWHPATAQRLREADLIQVDMAGFAPLKTRIHVTSLFFHRQAAFRPAQNRQPVAPIGGVPLRSGYDKPRTG